MGGARRWEGGEVLDSLHALCGPERLLSGGEVGLGHPSGLGRPGDGRSLHTDGGSQGLCGGGRAIGGELGSDVGDGGEGLLKLGGLG